MAAAVVWSQGALDDIAAIADHISRDSPFHAQRVVEELLLLANSLAEHPTLGRVVPELKDGQVRERFLYSYRVIYEIRQQQIYILAAIHGKRLLESIEERFEP